MKFNILFTGLSDDQLEEIGRDKSKKAVCKAVNKVLGFMETNLRHPSLQTHK